MKSRDNYKLKKTSKEVFFNFGGCVSLVLRTIFFFGDNIMGKIGALPSETIHELLRESLIVEADPRNVRPGSLDLAITDEVYRVNGAFLPGCDETVAAAMRRVGGIRLTGAKVLLEKGCCYCIRLAERIARFPAHTYAFANPKSSSGRVDMHVRLLVDRSSRYDAINEKYQGPLWLLVVPKTFPVLVSPGLALNQLRFFNGDTRFDELQLSMMFESGGGLLADEKGKGFIYSDITHTDGDGSILLSLGLNFEVPGYEAIETGEAIDLSLKAHYDPRNFFREVTVSKVCGKSSVTLRSGNFYILSSREYVRVPESLACEMRPMDERSGDLRSHYAGFIDPGWGIGVDGSGNGRPLTLEVRSFDNGIIIQDGQPIAKIRYEKMLRIPEQHYDQMSPTYGTQNGPKLGKQFAEWK